MQSERPAMRFVRVERDAAGEPQFRFAGSGLFADLVFTRAKLDEFLAIYPWMQAEYERALAAAAELPAEAD